MEIGVKEKRKRRGREEAPTSSLMTLPFLDRSVRVCVCVCVLKSTQKSSYAMSTQSFCLCTGQKKKNISCCCCCCCCPQYAALFLFHLSFLPSFFLQSFIYYFVFALTKIWQPTRPDRSSQFISSRFVSSHRLTHHHPPPFARRVLMTVILGARVDDDRRY